MSKSLPKGEFELISWIRRNQGDDSSGGVLVGIGDDCAIVDFSPESFVLVTTDMLLDGRHFRLKDDGPQAVGYKAMGVNLSDVAAMAGSPRFAVVSVALPRADAVAVAQGLHEGLKRMADRFGVILVGGDTNAWDGPLVVSVTLLGEPTMAGAATRSGAGGRRDPRHRPVGRQPVQRPPSPARAEDRRGARAGGSRLAQRHDRRLRRPRLGPRPHP